MKLERMEGVEKIEEADDEEQGDQQVKEEGEKDPEDWEEYSLKQRKQRGFANTGDEVVETDTKDEQQTREEDHETMTSGLSENEAGNESGEEGQVDDAKSTVTVTAEPEQIVRSSSLSPSFASLTRFEYRNQPTPNPNKTTNPKHHPKNDHSELGAPPKPAIPQPRIPRQTSRTWPSTLIRTSSPLQTTTRTSAKRTMKNLAQMAWWGGRRRDRLMRMGM